MLARVPVLLQLLDARMSSIPRSRMTIDQVQADVNGETTTRLERPVLAAHHTIPDGLGRDPILMVREEFGIDASDAEGGGERDR